MRELFDIALSLVKGVGASKHRVIVDSLGSAEMFFSLTPTELRDLKIPKFDKTKLFSEAEKVIVKHKELGISTILYSDDEYPTRLKDINQPPPYLFYVGNIELVNRKQTLGIVGTRNMTECAIFPLRT